MFSNNKWLKSMLFSAIMASIISIFMFQRKKESPVVKLPMNSFKKGTRIIQAGTRNAVRSAKQGLRVLNR